MKRQNLFSGENKKNISKCHLLKLLPKVLRINILSNITVENFPNHTSTYVIFTEECPTYIEQPTLILSSDSLSNDVTVLPAEALNVSLHNASSPGTTTIIDVKIKDLVPTKEALLYFVKLTVENWEMVRMVVRDTEGADVFQVCSFLKLKLYLYLLKVFITASGCTYDFMGSVCKALVQSCLSGAVIHI